MKKVIKLQVLMAGDYSIARGKKIDFQLDTEKGIYIASCEGEAFGVLKALLCGTRGDLGRLGCQFSGTAIRVAPGRHDMEVKVFAGKERLPARWENGTIVY